MKRFAQKKKTAKKNSARKLNIFFSFLIFLLLAGYLVTLNSITANGYKIDKMQDKISELKKESSELILSLSSMQSMETVSKNVTSLGMVEAGSIDYVMPDQPAMAKK